MNRRSFMQVMAGVGAVTGFRVPLAKATDYRGKLFVFVQARGGWDPTSLCDPKTNVAGEPIINHWAEAGEVRQAGNIRYAPFAKNQAFFDKYYQRILVVNGVDAQTNSHSAGVTHNWSGRISEGYPTTTALLAAHNGAGLSMPYLSFGGFSNTAGVAVFTRLNNPGEIRNIAKPELLGGDATRRPYFSAHDWASLTSHRDKRMARLAAAPNLMPRDARNRELYAAALDADAAEGLRSFADMIPSDRELNQVEEYGLYRSSLKRQAQLTVLAFKAGVAVSADLFMGGFDTHDNHDPDQNWLLGNLTDSIDYLWDYAELHGVADRMVVVMGSDFGRTNKYNSDLGKDHWPIGSFIIMEKNQGWTNRVIG
ncbi:MAG: DUF1501 domain-containing protein, partial [Acidobacteriia bacterium]|nr:DUF1501 domain-containing protein [Terriglobia bacterium]